MEKQILSEKAGLDEVDFALEKLIFFSGERSVGSGLFSVLGVGD